MTGGGLFATIKATIKAKESSNMSVPIVHHTDYYADIGAHVFPTQKFTMVLEAIRNVVGDPGDCLHAPEPASRAQLLRAHTSAYLDDLSSCNHTQRTLFSELPLTTEITNAFYLMAGGSCLAADLALSTGCAINLGGGFHHAFADHAEGFCYINDVAVAARHVQAQHGLARVAIIDTDLHQGNGTASIFREDPSVYTFSIHQEHLYPEKQKSDLDIGLANEIGDHFYLEKLQSGLDAVFGQFQPQFAVYVGGVDPYVGDLLGSLRLSKQGLTDRDRLVFETCRDHKCPVIATLAGGYAADFHDTVLMHVNTYIAMRDVFA